MEVTSPKIVEPTDAPETTFQSDPANNFHLANAIFAVCGMNDAPWMVPITFTV